MEYRFTAFGHENVTGKHKNTLEFTKDKELRLEGDCILGVKADFNLFRLRKIVEKGVKLKMVISADGVSDFVVFEPNPDFNDSHEIVVRKSEFNSKRTFGVRADKACAELKRE
ncbi:MAG: DUF371 domain-containing protein, partial [Nanoarchaeota archaeon]|nr:DUF371 domain-containing protein [Nanoarchaeota archaeon]